MNRALRSAPCRAPLLAAVAALVSAAPAAGAAVVPEGQSPAPGTFPAVTVTSDLGTAEAARISSCASTPTGSTCGDGTVVGSPILHATRGAPLTVHVEGGTAPAELTLHDRSGRLTGGVQPDRTFAPLPPGTTQFSVPPAQPSGGYASLATTWDTPGWRGDATYAVQILFASEATPTRVVAEDLLRRHRPTRPPGLRVRLSTPGTVTIRWRSGARSGQRVVRVPREFATVALRGLPGRPRHAVRVSVALDPADPGFAPSRSTRVFRRR